MGKLTKGDPSIKFESQYRRLFMDFQNQILSRRSIRKYTGDPIGRDKLKLMLEAAMAAPSAVAKDPWAFYAVQKRSVLSAMTEVLPHGKMLSQAAAAVLICGLPEKAHLGETGEPGYMLQDCSAAVENLILSARGMGIGSVWLGVYPNRDRMEGLRDLFEIPGERIPLAVVSLGYPGESPPPRTRYREDRVVWVD
jgi:nitroreductase